jgi:Spy/CpxP family protein refolding chaperone
MQNLQRICTAAALVLALGAPARPSQGAVPENRLTQRAGKGDSCFLEQMNRLYLSGQQRTRVRDIMARREGEPATQLRNQLLQVLTPEQQQVLISEIRKRC